MPLPEKVILPIAPDIRVVWRCLNPRCHREKRQGVWGPPQPLNFGQPIMAAYCGECGKYQPAPFAKQPAVSEEQAFATAERYDHCLEWCITCGKVRRNGQWEMLLGGPLLVVPGKGLGYENGRLFIGEPEPRGAHCPACPDPLHKV